MSTDRDMYGAVEEEIRARKQGNSYILTTTKGTIGKITYTLVDVDTWVIDHTYVDGEYRGRDLGKQLLGFVVDEAREKGRKIIPSCSYALAQFKRNSAYEDVWEKTNTEYSDTYSSGGTGTTSGNMRE